MLQEHQIKILMLSYELEKTLHELYLLFSEKFSDHNNLWDPLIKEEEAHAEAVRKLYQLSYDGKCVFDEGKIKPAALQSIIDYLKNIIETARQGKLDACKAITFTVDVENSLLEKDIFRHFKVSPQFSGMLQALHEGTRSHAQLAKKELEKILL